jgi:hypothetical protein
MRMPSSIVRLASSRSRGSLRAILLARYGKIEVNLRACRVRCLSARICASALLCGCSGAVAIYLPPLPVLPAGGVHLCGSTPTHSQFGVSLTAHPLIIQACHALIKALLWTCLGGLTGILSSCRVAFEGVRLQKRLSIMPCAAALVNPSGPPLWAYRIILLCKG